MALILRTNKSDGTSKNDFQWNLETGGVTTAPDWDSRPECGNGLHGFLNGEGDGGLANWSDDAIWMVVETIGDVIDLGGKVKFESGITKFAGSRFDATSYLVDQIGSGFMVIGGTAIAGNYGTATAGYYGTATAGKYSTATAGDYGMATAGDYGTATAGYYGTATAGYYSTATAGDYGMATAGDYGMATAGDYGTATAGYYGTATAGDYGTATAGYYGTIVIAYYHQNRRRYKIGYIGEGDLVPGTAYRLSDQKKFTPAL